MATPARYDSNTPDAPLLSDKAAEDFDLAAWIEGVKPITHAVTIYQRGDLVADLDVVKNRLEKAKLAKDTKQISELTKQARAIIEVIEQTALDVVVEGWSQDKVEEFRAAFKSEGLNEEEITIHQVAAQVIIPDGFTTEFYKTLLEVIRPQAEQVAAAVFACNMRVPAISVPS